MNSQLTQIVARWREAIRDGDSQFSSDGVDAVVQVLTEFEVRATAAAQDTVALLTILRETVHELACLGGLEGRYGCFLETDEREELVPFLLDIVGECGLALEDGEDPTESYRMW